MLNIGMIIIIMSLAWYEIHVHHKTEANYPQHLFNIKAFKFYTILIPQGFFCPLFSQLLYRQSKHDMQASPSQNHLKDTCM